MNFPTLIPRFLCLPFCLVASVWAQTTEPAPLSDRFSIEAGLWLSTGEDEWTERGRSGDGLFIDQYRSKLEYNDLDAPLLLVEAQAVLTPRIRLAGRFGTGDVKDANGADNDWVDGPRLTREFYVSRSESDLDGETQFWDVEVLYRLKQKALPGVTLDLFGAFGQYTDEFTSGNGRQTLLNEAAVLEPINGLASTYDFEWNALTFGIQGDWASPSGFHVEGRLGLMPWVDYEGKAFWNLRSDFKRSPPNFVHDADGGFGVDSRLALGYDWNQFGAKLGYWVRQYEVDRGISETFFVDGSSAFADVEAESLRHGFFGTVGLRF